MANLKEIRMRIVSVNSTMQITSAMKMVSAAKLKRAQDAITKMRPYANKLQEILSNVSSAEASSTYSQQRDVKNVLIVAITSNRGLCGGFNNNIIKEIRSMAKNETANVQILSLGKKAHDVFKRTSMHTDAFGEAPFHIFDHLTFNNSSAIANEIMSQFAAGKFDKVYIAYNRFKNAATQEPTVEQFLPVAPPASSDNNSNATDYIYEPQKEQILEELIPRSLKVQLFKALLDSWAAEQGARMTAMHKATDNAAALVKDLKLTYNKARQAAITGEILEIVAGAEALNG